MTYYKQGNNYMTPEIEAKRLHSQGSNGNRASLVLATGITAVTDATKPEVRTTGNTKVKITGKCEVTGAPAANMVLATFPAGFQPHNLGDFVVSKENAGTFTVESVELSSDGISAHGTPVANDIYHLDSIEYLTTFE